MQCMLGQSPALSWSRNRICVVENVRFISSGFKLCLNDASNCEITLNKYSFMCIIRMSAVSLRYLNTHGICSLRLHVTLSYSKPVRTVDRHNLWIRTIQTPTHTAPPTLPLLTSRLYPSLLPPSLGVALWASSLVPFLFAFQYPVYF